ncbi:MAG: carboxylesterase family protein, partial [Planctomycetota bacterium]
MPVIDTPLGPVRGKTSDGYRVFRGIRYARAPVGDLRFKPPVPVEPWTDVYDAMQY